jgi:hypothetical protein
VFLTPHVAQQEVIIPFDQGEECKPVTFRMKPAWVVKAGARYQRHTPDPEQLRGTGLRVADEQPHLSAPNGAPEALPESPSGAEKDLAQSCKPQAASGPGGAIIAPVDNPESVEPALKRKPRVARAKVSAVKLDGSIPVTLGGKLPPISVLARREFGLRALRR